METLQGTTKTSEFGITETMTKGGSSSVFYLNKDQDISTELIRKAKDFERLRDEWNELLDESDAHIFQSFEWQYLWWSHFGNSNELNIIVFRKSGQLVGIAPFYIDETHLFGNKKFRKLKLIGSAIPGGNPVGTFADYSPSDYLDLIVHSEYREEVAKAFLGYVEQTWEQFDLVELDEANEESIVGKCLIPMLKQKGWDHKKQKGEVCPYIVYSDTMEEYLSDLDRKARYELRYSKRAVTEKDLFAVEKAESEPKIDKVFSDFVALHKKRWNKEGMPGAFADQRYTDFLKDIALVFNERGWLRLTSAVDEEGSRIAVDYAFAFKGRTYDYQKAFDIDTPLAKYSPGRALMYFLMEDTIEDDRPIFELLRGGENYKFRVANESKHNWKFTIPNPSRQNHFKHQLYRIHNSLSKLYIKIGREKLLMKIHLDEWGLKGLMTKYTQSLYERVKDKLK